MRHLLRFISLLSFSTLLSFIPGCSSSAENDEANDVADGGPEQIGTRISVEGGTLIGAEEDELRIFLNIPYAAPPVGDLRFRDPQPVVSWEGERDATELGPNCPQPLGLQGPNGQSEDCLQLNVWAHQDEQMRPVMVFLHGGAFIQGSATQALYDGAELARNSHAVIVTINYRLGVAGYLASPLLAAESGSKESGNYGLKDQLAALQWVKHNISAFGGDAGNVTVFGESAGAISICALMGVPEADGLYHRAILESGLGCDSLVSADEPSRWGQPSAHSAGETLIERLGCTNAPNPVACLRDLPIEDLVSAVSTTELLTGDLSRAVLTSPHVDGSFVVEQPIARVAKGQADVPTIAGMNEDESVLFYAAVPIVTRAGFREALSSVLPDAQIDAVMDIYSLASFPIAKTAFLTFYSDFFSCSNLEFAKALQEGAPAYVYEFRRTPLQFASVGAFHGLELPYVFGTFNALLISDDSTDRELSATMQEAWSSFAASGVPNVSSDWKAIGEGQVAVFDDTTGSIPTLALRDGRCQALQAAGVL